ncbi:MAG: hypothetical protein FWE70_07320, partial [Oscillospiraceae bacterium]|nr:hypothetical protein [Oscillospiraceae bacterium]
SCSTGHIGQRPEFDGVYSPYVILDFGKVITAFLEIEAEGVDGAILDIGYSERLIGGHFNISIENPFADRLIMGDGALTYRPFTWKAFRYVRLQLRESYGITKIRNVKAIISTYPYEVRGSFESSDPKLNRLYEICRRTVRLCSNEGIMDTPWREQGQFTGDASMVTLGVVYSCFGDTGLIGKYLRQCAETQQITGFFPAITNMNDGGNDTLHDYNLHYINALYEHYVYTGDRGWVDAYYPHVCKAVSAFMRFRDGHGMFDRLPALFLDWINLDRMGSSSTFNALMYATLGNVLEMARLKADRHMAGLCGEARERIKGSFDGRFLDRGLGLYRDGNHGDGLTDGLSEHANCAAILFGLADAGTAERIVDKLYVRKDVTYVEAQPFFTSIVLKALAVSGRMDLAVGVLRDRWVRRMVDKGASSVYEEWTANGSWRQGDRFCKVMRTESHAWSAFPAEFLIKHVAGLRIVEPGGGKVSASPIDPGFDFTAVYPLACGEVGVTCEKGSFRLEARGGVEIV